MSSYEIASAGLTRCFAESNPVAILRYIFRVDKHLEHENVGVVEFAIAVSMIVILYISW